MYLDDDAGVLVSACLFGDGVGAAVLSGERQPGRRGVRWVDSTSLMLPGLLSSGAQWAGKTRCAVDDGMLGSFAQRRLAPTV